MGGIERGERNLTLKSLERIAACIEVEPLVLLASDTTDLTPTLRAAPRKLIQAKTGVPQSCLVLVLKGERLRCHWLIFIIMLLHWIRGVFCAAA